MLALVLSPLIRYECCLCLPRCASPCCADKWSPVLQIRTVLLSIQALLSAPNPDDPLANDVAEAWKTDEQGAIATAKQWTQMHAMKK